MSVIDPYVAKLERLREQLIPEAKEAIRLHSETILNLIKETQLGQGLNSDGARLSFQQGKFSGNGFYTEATEAIAHNAFSIALGEQPRKPKRAGSPYNFEWTGTTFDTMGIDLATDGLIHIFTADGKQMFLEELYGEIFSMTPANNDFVNNEIILPHLQKYILDNFWRV